MSHIHYVKLTERQVNFHEDLLSTTRPRSTYGAQQWHAAAELCHTWRCHPAAAHGSSNYTPASRLTEVLKVGMVVEGCAALDVAKEQHAHIAVDEPEETNEGSDIVESWQGDHEGGHQGPQALQGCRHSRS